MGVVICETHGSSSLSLASPNVKKDIVSGTFYSQNVREIDVEFFEDLTKIFVIDDDFFEGDSDDWKGGEVITGKLAETVIHEVRPICTRCLKGYLAALGFKA